MRRTKILVTLGPASSAPPVLDELVEAGADAFRINFSHGSDEEHRATIREARKAAERHGRELAIMADLQGPKLRIGEFASPPALLTEGSSFVLDRSSVPGDASRVGVSLPGFVGAARPGDPILLGDGNVELTVQSADAELIVTKVAHGGPVSSHAGLFLPRAHLRTAILAPKDRHDLSIALHEGVDFVALSFVRDARDLGEASRAIDALRPAIRPGLIAKIERAEALAQIDGILNRADGIMVARGDLGIEVPLQRLALEQKALVERANRAAKIAIVATQLLISMVTAPRPTRAEATDVANAVLDGADAVMLSEESAIGQHPVESVQWLDRIARAAESELVPHVAPIPSAPASTRPDVAVAAATVRISEELAARAIVTPTHSGRTATLVASHRPVAPVWALSSHAPVRRQLALTWGVERFASPRHLSLVALRDLAVALGSRNGLRPGDRLLLTAGYPVEGVPTNLLTVVKMPGARPPAPSKARRRAAAADRGRSRR
jgi:pyruvate kinase